MKQNESHIDVFKKQKLEAADAERRVTENEQTRKLDQVLHTASPPPGVALGGSADEPRTTLGGCGIPKLGKYDIAELFSPPRMTELANEYGLRGGWSIDDRCTDPITGRTYGLRNPKDQFKRRFVR